MTRRLIGLILAIVLALTACPGPTTTPPAVDATWDASSWDASIWK